MSEFIYKDYSSNLKFGEHTFNMPLNENMADIIDKSFNDSLIQRKCETIEDLDNWYNDLLDAIDKVLGVGAADKIMERFAHPGVMEVMSVINYITTEWRNAYGELVEEIKKTTPQPNRATRRAKRR